MSWDRLRDAAARHELTKTGCHENGVTFRSLSDAEKAKHAVLEVLLLEGERLREHLHGKKEGRRAADCLFLVRGNNGSISVVVVELKAGRADNRSFIEQYRHSVEDLRQFFANAGAGQLPNPKFATPRFPPTMERKDVTHKLPGFRVVSSLVDVVG